MRRTGTIACNVWIFTTGDEAVGTQSHTGPSSVCGAGERADFIVVKL
jgi:hypothetical protein